MEKEYRALSLENKTFKCLVSSDIFKIGLFWKDKELTRGNGFFSITEFSDGARFYSDKADCKIMESSESGICLRLIWDNLPIEEYWEIALKDNGVINWRIRVKLLQELDIIQHEVGLNIVSDYNRWLTSCEKGRFPVIRKKSSEWIDLEMDNPMVKAVGLFDSSLPFFSLPGLVFDFNNTLKFNRINLRNSPPQENIRGLLLIIPHKDEVKINQPGMLHDVFDADMRLIDKINLANYFRPYKKNDTQRWRSYSRDNIEINRSPGLSHHLLKRFKYHFHNRDIWYVIYRAILYALYFLKSSNIPDFFYYYRKTKKFPPASNKEKFVLENGRLKVVVAPSKACIDIYWDNKRLTENLGFVTIISERFPSFRRHYSNRAHWSIIDSGKFNLILRLHFSKTFATQDWVISLEDEYSIKWDVSITPERTLTLAEQEIGIMLRSMYRDWINYYEEGEFGAINPQDREWKELKLYNLASKVIGARSYDSENSLSTAVLLDFSEVKKDTCPVIRNSNYDAKLRLLLAQVTASERNNIYKIGCKSDIFSGIIKIIDKPDKLENILSTYRRSSYRHRLPFYTVGKEGQKYVNNNLSSTEVILANLPWKKNGRSGVRAGSRWPHIKSREESSYLPFPFFLAYTASLLLERGINVRIIDAIAENMSEEDFLTLVNKIKPRLLIAEVSTPSLVNDIRILKGIDKRNTRIAVCGLDFTIRNPLFLKKNDFIDFVMIGEYEYTALELFNNLNDIKKMPGIAGIIYRDGDDIKTNSPRRTLDDLDLIPWPLREQLPMDQYMDAPGNIPVPNVQMLASRGCPFVCSFCAWPQIMYNNNTYRMRKPELVVDEMQYLIKERKFKSVYFDDDTFNINKINVLKICEEINDRALDIPWAIMARADTMDEEMLLKMKKAGLCAVKYGVESADQKLLDSVRKKMDLLKTERMIRFTHSLGIKTHLTFTFGLPGESLDTIKKTIDFAASLDPETIQFSILTPYPGTEYYKQLDAQGYIVSNDLADYDGAHKSVIRTEHLLPADLERAKEEAWRAWKRHKRRRYFIFSMPLKKELRMAFKSNMRDKGLGYALIKTVKFIFNIA